MGWLLFYLNFARLQAFHGRAVSPKEISIEGEMPISTVHRYLSRLIKEKLIKKVGHGRYKIYDNECAKSVGYATLTPFEIRIYELRNRY